MMKKLVSVVLLLCLALAAMPAGAVTAGSFRAKPLTIDLTGKPVEFSFRMPDDSSGPVSQEDIAAIYASDGFSMYNTIILIMNSNVTMVSGSFNIISGEEDPNDPDGSTINVDINADGIADIAVYAVMDEYGVRTVYKALPNATCDPVSTVEYTIPTSNLKPPPFDLYYFCPLTFIFDARAVDATGSYELSADGATFVKPAKSGSSAKIPDTVTVGRTTFPVTKIADNAFKGQKKLTKVTIGANIKEIGRNAFANCAKLKTVSGGANVEIIGDQAFSGCKALKKFTIGAKVVKIGKKAFYKCSALKKITIRSKLLTKDTVGSSAFKGIYKTATIKVPKAVKKDYSKWLLKKGVKKTMKIK